MTCERYRALTLDDYRASSRCTFQLREHVSRISPVSSERAQAGRSPTVYRIIEKVEIALANDPSTADFSANTNLSRDAGVRLGRSPV